MDQRTIGIIVLCVLVVSLVAYIIALVKSKRGEMVFTANGWDMALLLICPVLLLIGEWMRENPELDTARYVLLGLSGACFLGTVLFSIFSNKGSFWKITCSILAKIFVVWLTVLIILLLIAILFIYIIMSLISKNEEDDGEYILLKYDKFLKAYVGYRI